MTHKAVRVSKPESPSPRWIVETWLSSLSTRNKLVFWRHVLAMYTSVFGYYQDQHEKPDRSLNRRGYHVLLTVWSILWSKRYSIPLLTPDVSATFGWSKMDLSPTTIIREKTCFKIQIILAVLTWWLQVSKSYLSVYWFIWLSQNACYSDENIS